MAYTNQVHLAGVVLETPYVYNHEIDGEVLPRTTLVIETMIGAPPNEKRAQVSVNVYDEEWIAFTTTHISYGSVVHTVSEIHAVYERKITQDGEAIRVPKLTFRAITCPDIIAGPFNIHDQYRLMEHQAREKVIREERGIETIPIPHKNK